MLSRFPSVVSLLAFMSVVPGATYLAGQEAPPAEVSRFTVQVLLTELAAARLEMTQSLLEGDFSRVQEIREVMLVWADEQELFVPIFDELLEGNQRQVAFSVYRLELVDIVNIFFDPLEDGYNNLMGLLVHEMNNPACDEAALRALIGQFWSRFAQYFPESYRSEIQGAGQLIGANIVM